MISCIGVYLTSKIADCFGILNTLHYMHAIVRLANHFGLKVFVGTGEMVTCYSIQALLRVYGMLMDEVGSVLREI
jgi:hypothetical protein